MTEKNRSDAAKKAAATRKQKEEAEQLAEQGRHPAPEGAPTLESPEAPVAPPVVGEISHPLDRNESGFTEAPVDAHAPKRPPAA